MNAVIIVNTLYKYLSLLDKIVEVEKEYLKETGKSIPADFFRSVSSKYDTITTRLNYKPEEGKRYSDYLWATFTIEEQNITLEELGCSHIERENVMRDFILQHMPTTFPSTTPADAEIISKETEQYLTIADEIAKPAYLYSSGDQYRPGFFSEVSIHDAGITLKQNNHWNARSISHKKDYHLRTLEFYIPRTIESKPSFWEEKIGRMIINFSDNSSSNNKKCGDEIFKKIQEQKIIFENENL